MYVTQLFIFPLLETDENEVVVMMMSLLRGLQICRVSEKMTFDILWRDPLKGTSAVLSPWTIAKQLSLLVLTVALSISLQSTTDTLLFLSGTLSPQTAKHSLRYKNWNGTEKFSSFQQLGTGEPRYNVFHGTGQIQA